MIVYGMTEKEVMREVLIDMVNAFRYEDRNSNKFRRQVIKSSTFPVYRNIEYLSPKKNKWLILLEARNKKEHGDMCRVTYIVTYQTPHGIYAVMVSFIRGNPQLIYYPPHFFVRYRDRYGIDLSGLELIKDYFKHNNSYVYSINGNECYGSSKSGVALGYLTIEDNILFKTFITYDMLKGGQIEEFTRNEEIRKEIHDEMIKNG